ncbi:SGNH/GDSL hydrolase family protein [Paenibacillus koleovorans]|uniref:SGNH/GDSL hydrolase family protein n=1 Tax=Paenibacillus koleovorans TaxID=121608 RepID=UPI000FDA5907|nr:SGNH/GDSL hydrolase family protein [Paenibacillus koleovorans]
MKPIYEEPTQLSKAKKIVFLGDSVTDEGTYISYLDAYFLQNQPDHPITFINLGVSSETASGLSEPEHPFPRPCIHDRLERALQESRPDCVVICYGMNDGIYYPFSEERFAAYQLGIHKVIRSVQQTGAKAIVMTPPPFDPQSLRGANLLPDGENQYSYLEPYVHYNEVLGRYSEWLMSLGSVVDGIVPIYEPLLENINRQRTKDSSYISGDGIHPNSEGHWVIAKSLLAHLFHITLDGVPEYVLHPERSPFYSLVRERHRLLSSSWKEHVGHTNVHKAEALPLDIAIQCGEQLKQQILELSP